MKENIEERISKEVDGPELETEEDDSKDSSKWFFGGKREAFDSEEYVIGFRLFQEFAEKNGVNVTKEDLDHSFWNHFYVNYLRSIFSNQLRPSTLEQRDEKFLYVFEKIFRKRAWREIQAKNFMVYLKDDDMYVSGILNDAKKRLFDFIRGNSLDKIFKRVDWNEYSMLTGSKESKALYLFLIQYKYREINMNSLFQSQYVVDTFYAYLAKDRNYSALCMFIKKHEDAFRMMESVGFLEDIIEKFYEMLSYDDIITFIRGLKAYTHRISFVSKKVEEEVFLRNSILESIPLRVEDLYPMARSIKRHFTLHVGPTNSGKTHDALESLMIAKDGGYFGPLRLLAYEQYSYMNENGCPCDLVTGEERKYVPDSTHVSCTIEMLDTDHYYSEVVIDEAEMLDDEDRGYAWTTAILGAYSPRISVILPEYMMEKVLALIKICGDTYDVVRHERLVPLKKDVKGVAFPGGIRTGDACIVFSKRDLYLAKSELDPSFKTSVIYGALPYDVRENEARRFMEGETKVVIATDAIGFGMNLPIKRVVFLASQKYDGHELRELNPSEVKQIAGRAGRYGIYDVGEYTAERGISSRIADLYESDEDTISDIYVGFPKSLIYVDTKLSLILNRWNTMPLEEGFTRKKMVDELFLAKKLEEYTNDKELIYDFITMPFQENDYDLLNLFIYLFEIEVKKEEFTFKRVYKVFSRVMNWMGPIDYLEKSYRMYDLIIYYMHKFNHMEEYDLVSSKRETISQNIIKLLLEKARTKNKKEFKDNYMHHKKNDSFNFNRKSRTDYVNFFSKW